MAIKKTKLIRVTTVPTSLHSFCSGLMRELTEEGYEVVAVSSPNTPGRPVREQSELEQFGAQEGIRTIAVPMERHISPVSDLKSLWQMWRVMRPMGQRLLATQRDLSDIGCKTGNRVVLTKSQHFSGFLLTKS